DLKPDAKVEGITVIELGTGNEPQDMFVYEKGGKSYILMCHNRKFGGKNPVGPSPYWTAKVDQSILREGTLINEKAIWRIKKGAKASEPTKESAPYVSVATEYHGVMQMDRLDRERALVLQAGDKGLNLKVLALP